MKWFRYNSGKCCALLILAAIFPGEIFANTTYKGWSSSVDKSTNAVVYRPASLLGSDDILVKYYPAVLLENSTPHKWLLQKLNNSAAPRGKWTTEANAVRQTANYATGERGYKLADGQSGVLYATAYSADQQYVRLAVTVLTLNEANKPHQQLAGKILGNIIKVENSAALKEGRGHAIEISPPKVKGIKTGVPIKPGRYVGAKTKGTKILRHYEVVLYENGGLEFLKGGMGGTIVSAGNNEGHYSYSQLTGRMQMGDGFRNSTYNPDEEYCIYGIEQKTGKHLIYAADGILSRYITRLYWHNTDDRPSPELRKQASKLARAEENRYKHVTKPGDGIQPGQIETVLYSYELISGIESKLEADAYVLMKDGRVMDGMPVAPDMLNVSKSRSREPDRWGYWKHQDNQYRFAWDIDRKHYVAPNGDQIVASPIPAGTKLEGKWSNASTTVSMDFSSVTFWGVVFNKNGRFEKFRNNMMQGGGEISSIAGGPMISTYSDDEGSVTSVIGSNVGGGSVTKKNSPGSDRKGWYEFDGYNLTLKFDNGSVRRLLTFTTGDNFQSIWFDDDHLSRKAQ